MTSTTTSTTSTGAAPVETVDEWAAKIARLRDRKPPEKWLTVADEDAVAAVEQARMDLYRARSAARDNAPGDGLSADEVKAFIDDDPQVKAAAETLETRISDAADAEITFHFRALPPDVYERLGTEFPPTDEQVDAGLTYDATRYILALVARCSVKPLTEAQVEGLFYPTVVDGVEHPPPFTQGDVNAVVQTCRDLNERPRLMLGKGSRPTPD